MEDSAFGGSPKGLPANLRRISDIVAEYDEKAAEIENVVEAFKSAVTAAEMGSCVGGTYAASIFDRYTPSLSAHRLRANLLESAWRHVYAGLNLATIAPASDRSRFELAFKDPAPFTLDNIRATFGKYITDPRAHILRGLAECFGGLDQAFKSHDKMRVGVKGLPKRIIIERVDDYTFSYGASRLKDTINAIRVFSGQPHVTHDELNCLLKDARDGQAHLAIRDKNGVVVHDDGLFLRRFQNGNAHLSFSPDAMLQINRALVEHYGDVLPDCPEERPTKAAGTAVSKDLQFYRTPAAAADLLVYKLAPRDGAHILEPSCGDGALMDALKRYAMRENKNFRVVGIEFDSNRAADAIAKGHKVSIANFLQVEPDARFDCVLMNPPFYGKHYQKHVEHARRFLKPRGQLASILPITALTDHGFIKKDNWMGDRWTDLPVGSFSESGTNINTGIALLESLS
ncbi:MAG: DUF4942 domain-containing protein [Paracoccaceae bacterium]